MASKRTKAEAPQAKFPVKRRKELEVYLSEVREDRYLHISNRSIENIRKSTHVRYYPDRLKALQDSNGEQHLINCVKAMCSNFASFYSTFLPRKRYVNFQLHSFHTSDSILMGSEEKGFLLQMFHPALGLEGESKMLVPIVELKLSNARIFGKNLLSH